MTNYLIYNRNLFYDGREGMFSISLKIDLFGVKIFIFQPLTGHTFLTRQGGCSKGAGERKRKRGKSSFQNRHIARLMSVPRKIELLANC